MKTSGEGLNTRMGITEGEMPSLGLGTWELRGEECVDIVEAALEMGYRHVDTAAMYENEEEVGRGIRRSSVDRDEIFLVTKVWYTDLDAPSLKDSAHESLQKLGTDYVDLLLMHWPHKTVPMEQSLGALNELREEGKTRHIGVSNFTVDHLNRAVEVSDTPILCNQVEYHPYLSQQPVLNCCRQHGTALVAYCPLARGRVIGDSTLREVGEKYDKTEAQVALRWLIQQDGVGAIPRSSSQEHIRENADIFDFNLSDQDMERISALQGDGRVVTADKVPIPVPDWDT